MARWDAQVERRMLWRFPLNRTQGLLPLYISHFQLQRISINDMRTYL